MTGKRRSIVIHGYGTYAIVYRHMLEAVRSMAHDVEWSIILPTSHHLDVLREVLPPDRILCLEHEQSRVHPPLSDLSELGGYGGNIYADIEVEKKVYKHRPARQQLTRAIETYRIYRNFLVSKNATHVLLGHVETFDGKVLISLAKELGMVAIVPIDLRNIGGSTFSADERERLPDYRKSTPETLEQARQFLTRFRSNPSPASNPDQFARPGETPLPIYQKPFVRRALGFVSRTIRNPSLFEPALLKISLQYAFPRIREAVRSLRALRNGRTFDLGSIEEVPKRFIYYPLQTTPESSINTPAPYFIDQLRAIDAIRFAMPSNCTLVVKEHWASIGIRPLSFYRALRRKAGVQIAHFSVPSLELIRRAQLTVSVTGTATLEAFLLGRPSLALGACFIAEYLGGVCPLDELRGRMAKAIRHPVDDEAVVNALAEVFSVRYECLVRSADEPGFHGNRPEHIRRMLRAVLEHISRLEGINGKPVRDALVSSLGARPPAAGSL
jgi:hypothetical protein